MLVFTKKQLINNFDIFLQENSLFILFFFIFNINIRLYYNAFIGGDICTYLDLIINNLILFSETIFVSAIIYLIPFNRIKHYLKISLLIFSGLFFLADIFSLYMYGCAVNTGIIEVILATNQHEASEYIKIYAKSILLVLLAFSFCVGLLFGKLRSIPLHDSKVLRILMIISCFTGLMTCYKYPDFMLHNCLASERYLSMLNETYTDIQQYQKLSSNEIEITKDNSSIPYVIFILGESTNRNHMGIYGYDLDTTPLLQQRLDKGELILFQDVISPHAHTMPVLKKLFTFYRTGADGKWFEYNNLFDILQKSDYKTIWLSNQESSGIYGNIGKLYANLCSNKKFTSTRDSADSTINVYWSTFFVTLCSENIYLNRASIGVK